MGRKALLALGAMVLAVIGVAALAAFFVSRDEPTVPQDTARTPGVARTPNSQPQVARGNVVLLYSDERLTRDLRRLAERTAGAPDPALAAAGQAVLVERRPNLRVAVTAVTSTRELQATGPGDPALEAFIEYWLGRAP